MPREIAWPRLWITSRHLSEMMTEASAKVPLETGGILMGYTAQPVGTNAREWNAGVVTAAIGPGPRAVHERNRFVPDHEFHRAEVARLYEHSGRTWRYLGDWHSHPGTAAYMSPTDARTLARIARSDAARAPQPVMLILGQRPTIVDLGSADWQVRGWRFVRRGFREALSWGPFGSTNVPLHILILDPDP